MTSTRHVLVVRLDSMGDMLVCGPAVRAAASAAERLTVLASPQGRAAAELLPGVDEVLVWACPWIVADPPQVDRHTVDSVVEAVAAADVDEALILTSFHQSALPTALLLRLAGVRRIAAVSDDYPGSLLDVRIPSPPDAAEPERMLAIAEAAGYRLPAGDDGRLMVRLPDHDPPADWTDGSFVVVHPGVTAPARAYPPDQWRAVVAELAARGWRVLVTGSQDEAALTAYVAAGAGAGAAAADTVRDVGGRMDLAELACALDDAAAMVVANTGPAHLAAAVGTPVVSLFAPVVPAVRWQPYAVPSELLGDQSAACRGSRARVCPIPGHPCLTTVSPVVVADAVDRLVARPGIRTEPALVGGAPVASGCRSTRGDA